MKGVSLLVLLIIALNATAQVDNLLKDDKVIWVGESSNDYLFDIRTTCESLLSELDERKFNFFEILKLQEIKGKYKSDGYHHFAKILWDAIVNNEINIYSDSTCTKLANKSVLYRTDTIDLDTESFEPQKKVVISELNPEDFKLFRVYNRLYYKPEKGIWEVRALSFAPIYFSDTLPSKPLFWIKCNFQKPLLDLSTIWKVRTYSYSSDFEKMKVLKNKIEEPPLINFFKVCKNKREIVIYSTQSWKSHKIENKKDLENRLFSTDTINEINPISYETKTKVTTRKADLNELKKLKLIQEWSWDEKQKNLSVKLVGVAPCLPEYDMQGNFLYYNSLFYRRFDE